jgi:hypothetical protein
MVDPDAEVHEVMPKNAPKTGEKPAAAPANVNTPAQVTQAAKLPENAGKPVAQEQPAANPVLQYLAKEREALRVVREINKAQNAALFKTQTDALKAKGLVPNKKLEEFTQDEATQLIQFMYTMFDPLGTVLKNDGKNS